MSLVNEHGADVLRLWVASQDYQDDIPFSHDILARVADTYRSIRNTLRILLGNLADFDPEKDSVPQEKWTELDRYIYKSYLYLVAECNRSYSEYQFSQVYQAINRFCAIELSSLYVDVLKDRMYCDAKGSQRRRAAQSAMNEILNGLVRLLAPIIPYTCEEAWQFRGNLKSVHSETFPKGTTEVDQLVNHWKILLATRSKVNEKLEEARRDKKIGKSVEARVEISRPMFGTGDASEENTKCEELFIVSKVVIKPTEGEETIIVMAAKDHDMKKCVRCWKYWDHVGSNPEHPELCDRCTKVVVDLGFNG